jgi:predicted MFS family arabinose efflux permease
MRQATAGIALPILALCLGHVFSNAVRTIPAVAADVLMRDLGLTAERLGQLTGAFPLAFAAVMIPVGIAMDRHGVKAVSLGLLATAGSGAVMAAFAQGGWSMLLAQIVLGAGCSGMLMCPIAFAARAVPGPRFAVWSGVIQAFGNSGMLLSASPLAWLIEVQGWRAGYLACLGLAAVAAVLIALLVASDAPAKHTQRSVLADARDVLRIARAPGMAGVMALVFCSFASVFGLRGLWGGPWLMEVKGLDRIAAGNLLMALAAALVAGPALAGIVARKFGHMAALLAASHLVCAGLFLAMIAGGRAGLPASFDLLIFVLFGLVISFQVLAFTLVRAMVPPEQTGRALSAANLFFFLGAAVLQVLSGLAAGIGGLEAALGTFAVALLVCPLLFLWWRPR